jgi:CxxC motif-containing protein (DUF1111 family)
MEHLRISGLLLLGLATTSGCHRDAAPLVAGEAGTPLPGLTREELSRFRQGEALFNRVYTPAEGMGPLFNENQCSACHTVPASGGTGEQRVLKATRYEATTGCDLLLGAGGENIRSQATPLLRAQGVAEETVPRAATATGRFTTTFLFGLGLVEAIPDKVILSLADPNDEDGDGISGRAASTTDGRLGRFGRKAELATIFDFVDGAIRLEMGLTTPIKPLEEGINGAPFPEGTDPAPEPEVDRRTLDLMTDYIRFLTPIARELPISEYEKGAAVRGERLFSELGCASCHVPSMRTGPSEIAALDRKTVALYSDLLLHDMGPGLADICGVTATPSEVRTELLMGLRHREVFLHDGLIYDLENAILRHGGEAQPMRDAFASLDWVAQEDLITFLETL